MNDRINTDNMDPLQPSTTEALATFEPQYALVAKTEAGYLDVAAKIAASGLLPKGMTEPQAALCMMAAGEYGISPLKAIQNFAVINGRPTPWGTLLRGICDHAGTGALGDITGCTTGVAEMKYIAVEGFYDADDDPLTMDLDRALRRAMLRRLARLGWSHVDGKWVKDPDVKLDVPGSYRCGFAVLKRINRPVRVEMFDSMEAQTAGLLGKSGPWSQYPHRMLEARAVTYALRALYADKLSGLGYTVEEMEAAVIDTTATEVPRGPVAGAVLDALAARPGVARPVVEDADFTEHSPVTPPPSPIDTPTDRVSSAPPAAGYVPVGEPGASEADDAAVPERATAAAEKPKSNGTPAKLRVKAAHDALKALVKGDQIDAILAESKKAAAIPDFLRVTNMSEEQRAGLAEQLEEHLARIRAARSVESNTGEGSDPTDF